MDTRVLPVGPKTAFWHCGVVVLLLAIAPNAAGQCYYTHQQVPAAPPGWYFIAQDMNEVAHVAATIENDGDFTRAGFWSPETGIYFLPMPPGIISMEAGGLNDHDVICGQMYSQTTWYGFIWDRESGQTTTIDLPEGAYRVEMNAINNANQVAATLYFWAEPQLRAVSWYGGAFYSAEDDPEVQTLDGYTINELGEMAGDAGSSGWLSARGYVADFPNVTMLPHPSALANAQCHSLSNNGFFGGWGGTSTGGPDFAWRGIVWTSGSAHLVSPQPRVRHAFIHDVNDAGRAVGKTYDSYWNGPLPIPLVWQDGVTTDLNTLIPGLPPLLGASEINNHGQIYAGRSGIGQFILTPVWLPGDLTGDCHVSAEDLILVLSNFGLPRGSYPRGEVDGDGDVDLSDLAIVLAHWGE